LGRKVSKIAADTFQARCAVVLTHDAAERLGLFDIDGASVHKVIERGDDTTTNRGLRKSLADRPRVFKERFPLDASQKNRLPGCAGR
jgi:hypothetical protein